jgi:hypothetical protein
MILYSKLILKILKFLIYFFKFAFFHNYSLPQFYSFLGRYEESFYAPPPRFFLEFFEIFSTLLNFVAEN